MNPLSWTGVYPAVTTSFDANGELDRDAFLRLLQAQADAGVDAIILGGSLGESSTLSADERMQLLRWTREALGSDFPVLVNVATGGTREAIELARRSHAGGADGLMVLPPMMYKPTDAEVVRYFLDIARATPLPVLVYNNPVDYKIEVTPDMFAVMLEAPTIQAVKESTRDLANVTRLRNRFGDRLKILTGVDTIATEALLMGADGWVAGLVNAFPRETVAIYRLIRQGRIDEAIAIHRWFLPMLELDIDPLLVQQIKLAATMTGIGTEPVRPPRMPLEPARRAYVAGIIEDGLATRPSLPAELWDNNGQS